MGPLLVVHLLKSTVCCHPTAEGELYMHRMKEVRDKFGSEVALFYLDDGTLGGNPNDIIKDIKSIIEEISDLCVTWCPQPLKSVFYGHWGECSKHVGSIQVGKRDRKRRGKRGKKVGKRGRKQEEKKTGIEKKVRKEEECVEKKKKGNIC